MTVCRIFSALAALLALLGGAGCGDRGRDPLPAETDEPYYVQGKQLMKQGRNPEALTAFLKVIDRRGERGAPESHLEAGNIYLTHTKDPVEAYHHFRRYLALMPTSKEAANVKQMVEAARREFARTLPARPLEDQSVKLEVREAMEKLQRENDELRAQIATLRGSGGASVGRVAPLIGLPDAPPVAPVMGSPLISAPSAATPAASAPAARSVAPISTPAATNPLRPTPTPAPTRPMATPTGGRTHTVQPKETLYGISVQYYGHGRNVRAIYQANRDSMRNETDVRPGMVLKLPPVDGVAPRR